MKKLFISIILLAALAISYSQCHQNLSICTTSVSIVMNDGSLYSWGSNYNGKLGDGTNTSKLVPTKIGTHQDWKFIASNDGNSWGIKTDGTLWHAGTSYAGSANQSFFKQVGTENDWSSISNYGSMAIKTNGTLWVYDVKSPSFFKQVGTDVNWKSAYEDIGASVAIKSDGTLWSINLSTFVATQSGTSNKWVSLTLFYDSFYGLQNDGTAWYGDHVAQADQIRQFGEDNDWKHIAWYTGIKDNGTLWSLPWQTLEVSQIGTDADWVEIYRNIYAAVGIKNNGDIYTIGSNTIDGILGNGTTTNNHSQFKKILEPCVITSTTPDKALGMSDEVYPCPALDQIYIGSKPEHISLTDMYGRSTTLQGSGTYNVEALAKGLYVLTYQKGQERKSFKIQLK